MKKALYPQHGPETKGPYSPAMAYKDLLFISGQGPVDPHTGAFKKGSIEEEMEIAAGNVKIILEASGSSLENILKITVYLSDMDNFAAMNRIYEKHFGPVWPARTTIQAARLPFDIKVELDVIAFRTLFPEGV